MATRRQVLAGLSAAALAPGAGWAAAGAPAYLAAAKRPDGAYRLFGLDGAGAPLFDLPLPGRGHAAAAHPARSEAVAFARRPGTFALVIDCAAGRELARLEAPAGRHFYGHGAFSADGALLYAPENDFEAARGVVGIWDAARGYARLDEFASGGVGPHDLKLLPGGGLVVANGGIETSPESGRAKLNLATMRSNLAFLSAGGEIRALFELEDALRLNSIRHLAVREDGLVAFAMQWEGDPAEAPPLLGLARAGGPPRLVETPPELAWRSQNYAGSVAFAGDGGRVAFTAPRGGFAAIFDAESGAFLAAVESVDICGVAPRGDGLLFTTGEGLALDGAGGRLPAPVAWDNHLVPIA